MGVEQLVLAAAIVQIAIVDVAILVDVVVERELDLAEGLAVDDDVVRLQSHSCLSGADYSKVLYPSANHALLALRLSFRICLGYSSIWPYSCLLYTSPSPRDS